MAYALVGSKGTVLTGTSGAAVTPSWGTSETRAANNLLILVVDGFGTATLPTAPAGWSIGVQKAGGTTCSTSVFYRVATGSDAAPTVAGVTGTVLIAQLAEFSGGATVTPNDKTASVSAGGSPALATAGSTDVAPGELVIVAAALRDTTNNTNSTGAWTLNNGAVAAGVNSNNGISTTNHFSFAHGITTSNGSADSASWVYDDTQEVSEASVLISFKLAPTVYTESDTISTKTTLASTETAQYVVSATISNKTALSSIDSEKSVESAAISGKTSPSSIEIERFVESAAFSSKTTLTPSTEKAQYTESAIIGSHSTVSSAEIVQDVESNTVTSKSSVIPVDSKASNETSTCTSKTSLTSNEFALFTESTTISAKTALSSSELYLVADTNICNSKTTILASDTTIYVESATCSSITLFSPSDVSICTDRDTIKTITSPSGTDTQEHTNVDYFDNATITSTTTLVSFEAGLIVELVGYAINRYIVSDIDTHYRADAIKHFKVQAGI